MKTCLECVPCFIHHAVEIAEMVTTDTALQERVVREALAMATTMRLDVPPPALARRLHAIAREITGVDDPYHEAKQCSTRFALDILPQVRRKVEASPDPFEAAVKMAIAGNLIDFGATRKFSLTGVEEKLDHAFAAHLDPTTVVGLAKAMEGARRILYLLDNCGEIVFDQLLIEFHRVKITAAVRGGPILNDATIEDARESGVADLVPVVNTGDRTPGILFETCSEEFRALYKDCDLVIAKGQGNYETLDVETGKHIIFLLKAKCPVVARKLGVELGTPLIIDNTVP